MWAHWAVRILKHFASIHGVGRQAWIAWSLRGLMFGVLTPDTIYLFARNGVALLLEAGDKRPCRMRQPTGKCCHLLQRRAAFAAKKVYDLLMFRRNNLRFQGFTIGFCLGCFGYHWFSNMEQHRAAPTTQSPAGQPVRAYGNLGAAMLKNSNAWVAREVEWFLALMLSAWNLLGQLDQNGMDVC
jgi:hypothetical protein